MKSFLIACILFFCVIAFVCGHTCYVSAILTEISDLTQGLPQTENEFWAQYPSVSERISELCALWDRHFPYIAFTVGYDNTNRCDDTVGDLEAYCKNRNADEFIAALTRFRDALSRLRTLESFHPESIF